MQNELALRRRRALFFLGSIVLVVFLIFLFLFTRQSNTGGISVTIAVQPDDATVYIDGKRASVGVNYVKPGEHTFVAKKTGFGDAVEKTTISESRTYVGLLPSPQSTEAKAWANSDEVSGQREEIGGLDAENRGDSYRAANPIIEVLPYIDISGPFSIDYGYVGAGSDKTYGIIDNSTPSGRKKALQWIRDKGYNPAELDIRFSDFINLLVGAN